MLPYFWYLLKVIICSGILLGYYWLFLRNKIFHQYNRFYLLMAMGLSLLLPLLKINFWQQHTETNGAILVLRAVSVGDEYMNSVVISAQKSFWNFQNLYPLLYWLVSLVFVFVLLRTLYIIRTLLKHYPVKQVEEVTFVNTNDDSTPFSFFKYIFWNSSIDMDTVTGRQIFKHEVAHIQEKHTYDKLFVNISLIFFWCNPFFWLYRKELNMIHEFIADKKAVEDSDTAAFANMILQAAYPRHRFELTNNFFHSPIKRRLMMLNMKQNKKANYLNQWFALPLMLLVFVIFSCKTKDSDLISKQEPQVNEVLTDSSNVNLKNLKEPITTVPSDDNKIFVRAEVEPQFIGGEAAWRNYLRKTLNASIPVDNGASAGKYTVIVKFIVNVDGSIRDVKCENDPGFGICDEAIRVIKKASKWEPAIQNGKKVNAYHKQPITFVIED